MARIGMKRLARLLGGIAGALPGLAVASVGPVAGGCQMAAPFDQPIASAASRFALPVQLLRAVIAVESDYAVLAVSPKGAMGLMQIMPDTWADLRLRHGLGANPFDPCDNILAGAAYLREMLDRYGDPGFLAAYNAGPGRYESWLRGARPLPAETLAYVDRVTARMAGKSASEPALAAPDPDAWRRGNLFVRRSETETATTPEPLAERVMLTRESVPEPHRETLFAPRSDAPK